MTTPALPLSRLRAAGAGRRAMVFAVVGVAALAVLVRAPFFFWPLLDDEGAYAYTAYWWSRGLTLYSDELWFDKPQAIFVAYKAGSLLLGDATWAIRLWAALWAAGATVIVWLIARRLFDGRVAVTAALLYALFSAHTHIDGYSANAEVFMLLPATLSAYYLLRGQPAAAGLAASAAVVLKPSGASALLLGVAWFAYMREGWRHWLRFAVASAALPVAALAHGALTVGLRDYLDAVVWQRVAVARPNQLTATVRGLVNTFPVWAPLGVLARFGMPGMHGRARVFLILWLLSSMAGIAMGGNWWPHYFMQLMPPLAVVAGAGLSRLWSSTVARRWAGLLLVIAALFVPAELASAGPHQGSWDFWRRNGYLVAEDAASYIRARTTEADEIFVAFTHADVQHLTRRRSSSPYLYLRLLLAYPGAFDRLIESIDAREPAYVLLMRPSRDALAEGTFLQALRRGYEVERVFEAEIDTGLPPVALYRRR